MDVIVSGQLSPRLRREMPEGVDQLRIMPRRSWKLIGLALVVILARDSQALVHLSKRHDWLDAVMIGAWTILAFMFIAACIGEFFGSETISVRSGELIIRRGIGPLGRAFRHPVASITELVSSEPTDKYGKRHLGNILLKPKAGAVRFECDGKTRYFADWLDEEDGERIVQWLRPKLPECAIGLSLARGGTANWRP